MTEEEIDFINYVMNEVPEEKIEQLFKEMGIDIQLQEQKIEQMFKENNIQLQDSKSDEIPGE